MYHIIGKRPQMLPVTQIIADSALGGCIGNDIIGAYLYTAPDGVIIEHEGNYYETRGRDLVGIDPRNPGEMITTKCSEPHEFTKAEAVAIRKEAVRLFEAYVLHHNYGDRQNL